MTNAMDEMDMDDKTSWMTNLNTSKTVSTVCVTMVNETKNRGRVEVEM